MANPQHTDASAMRCVRLRTVISVALLAGIAAVVSFGHMRELALRHGEASWSAMLIPLSVDGMIVRGGGPGRQARQAVTPEPSPHGPP
jgi:hypothetical protein